MRLVLQDGCAPVGQVGNLDHENVKLGKAGRARWLGKRPQSRGVAMNPVDHPHGGGEGKSSGGRHPVTPWGVPTKGYKTRTHKRSDRFIVRRRKKEDFRCADEILEEKIAGKLYRKGTVRRREPAA